MYTALITTELYCVVDRACLLGESLVVSGISRTPMTVSLLRIGVLLSKTIHFPSIERDPDLVFATKMQKPLEWSV